AAVFGECGWSGATPPLPASAAAAVKSPIGTARRAARSGRRIGRGFYGVGDAERRTAGDADGHPMGVLVSRVTLPWGVGPSYEVYVNGVRQQEGADFVREGGELLFRRSL